MISQALGNRATYKILEHVDEKNAIECLSDRLSQIIKDITTCTMQHIDNNDSQAVGTEAVLGECQVMVQSVASKVMMHQFELPTLCAETVTIMSVVVVMPIVLIIEL